MISFLKNRAKEWSDYRAFQSLDRRYRDIVFYSESRADWAHLGPIVKALTLGNGRHVSYVTSDFSDPVLRSDDPHIHAFCVGTGAARTLFFMTIEASAFVMTMPDLQSFHLKRSTNPVHYFYVFHSMASTHRVYKKAAFDAYDTIFCTGPHQIEEIRRTEAVYGLPPKRLVEHGYGRLDLLLAEKPQDSSAQEIPRVLVAPTWGPSSILEHCLDEVVEPLLSGGFLVSLRLHPMTVRHHPKWPERFKRKWQGTGRFEVETDVATQDSLRRADVMISEWSGAALEYAFGLEKPVIFIDTPPKINNPEHEKIGLPFFEDFIRHELGAVVPPHSLTGLSQVVQGMLSYGDEFKQKIRDLRKKWIFNVGRSGDVAARSLIEASQVS